MQASQVSPSLAAPRESVSLTEDLSEMPLTDFKVPFSPWL